MGAFFVEWMNERRIFVSPSLGRTLSSKLWSCLPPPPCINEHSGLACAGWGRGHGGTGTDPIPALWSSWSTEGGILTQIIVHVTEHSRGKYCEGTGSLGSECL